MEKLLPMEGIFEILAQNGIHYPENQFPLARMKDSFQNYVFARQEKNYHWQKWLKNR